MNSRKIKLLVVPMAFPENEFDIQGIFIKDYLAAVRNFCEISVLTYYFSDTKKGLFIDDEGDYKIYRLYIRRGNKQFSKAFSYIIWTIKIMAILKTCFKSVDVIHSHYSAIPGALTTFFARQYHIRHLITEHINPYSKIADNWITYRLSKYALEKCDCVLTVSDYLKHQILSYPIKPKRIETSYNPVNTDLFIPRNEQNHQKTILFVGRLVNFKGALRTVLAFRDICRQIPEWTLKIVGDGPDKKALADFVINNNLQARIKLLGAKTKEEIAVELNYSGFFVFPSEHETFGLVVAEAMASGLPVITSDTSAFPEFVGEETGILVNPLSISDLSEALLTMIENYSDYDPQKIRKIIVDRFSMAVFGQRLFDLYTKQSEL